MFTDIETNRINLGVASYGVSVTTLEEVFLKVGEGIGVENEEPHQTLFQDLSSKSNSGAELLDAVTEGEGIPKITLNFHKNLGYNHYFSYI